jgi:hypothetical protein
VSLNQFLPRHCLVPINSTPLAEAWKLLTWQAPKLLK